MRFDLEDVPPAAEEIERERDRLSLEMRHLRRRDAALTSLLIIGFSVVAGLAVYWATDNVRHAAIAASVFPALGAALAATGLITAAGFRSAARRLIELNHEITALTPITAATRQELASLAGKYDRVRAYTRKVEALGREVVNGEMALFWDWDASTEAREDRAREFVKRARDSIRSEAESV
jgi:hypothetical protein